MKDHATSGKRALAVLSESEMYRDYERAFTEGTGLPLSLHAPEMLSMVHYPKKQENPFCALVAKIKQSCAACYALQQKLEEESQFEPKTLKCFAGLCETAVPVRVGENLIAFLQTGQILLQQPDKVQFNRVAATLVKWGAEVDMKKVEEAWFNTRVLTPKQYEALIRLLDTFAKHLASCSQVLALHAPRNAAPAVARARTYIEDHSDEELSLSAVARVVNMSATYFSEKFKEVAGMNFVEYVARTRVEKARNLLQNPRLRISEIAFDVGFQSLSQFNRAFKQVVGEAPREYRASLLAAQQAHHHQNSH
ncbi:MAG: helix-turn-helix domain-containing protein [Chthoniobacteraceae bacterium]